MQQVTNPYPGFVGLDGKPLAIGKIYIGEENEDPETNPVTVYFDAAAAQTATQPIRTLAGYPDQNGSPAQLWVTGRYSIRVRNAQDEQVFYTASAGADGRPYHIHAEFLGDAPGVSALVCIHVFGIAVSLPANFTASIEVYVDSPPTDACDFDLRANGVSFGTLTIDTSGDVSVTCTAQDFVKGDRLTIVSPDTSTDIADFAFTIIGSLS
jgi:hypothetical protein